MVERDVRERGRTEEWVRYQYARDMKPMHDNYVEPLKEKANLVVDGTKSVSHCVSVSTNI